VPAKLRLSVMNSVRMGSAINCAPRVGTPAWLVQFRGPVTVLLAKIALVFKLRCTVRRQVAQTTQKGDVILLARAQPPADFLQTHMNANALDIKALEMRQCRKVNTWVYNKDSPAACAGRQLKPWQPGQATPGGTAHEREAGARARQARLKPCA